MIRRSVRANLLPRRSNWRSGVNFIKAVKRLYEDIEWRPKYFDSPLTYDVEEHHDLRGRKKRDLLKSIKYSTPFKKDLVAGFIKPMQNSAMVIAVVDKTCAENDAARYIRGLMRGVITAPTNEDEWNNWIMSGNKEFQTYLKLTGKKQTVENCVDWGSQHGLELPLIYESKWARRR
jgi:hypothetical protein